MPETPASARRAPLRLLVAAALAVAVLVLYAPVRHHDFVNLDDNEYVTENSSVRTGLSGANVAWALTAYHSGHWHPLTWLSLMADCEWSGTDAGALHTVNVVLAALGVVLLFLWVESATGCFWRSAFVAALFALHPLRVESFAWIAARKDVLSGLFLMLTLLAYVRYAKQASLRRYALVLVAFGLALLAKPTVAILPCGLFLLDFWPLRRRPMPGVMADSRPSHETTMLHLFAEKVPLLVLAALTLTQTWAAQHAAGAVVGENLGLFTRIGNALWNYALYIGRTFWPTNLAVFYPLRPVPTAYAVAAGVGLVLVTLLAWRVRAKQPYVLIGWLWFVGTLLPESGVIQFGGQAMADRYSYIPHIGLFLACTWAAADFLQRVALPRSAVGGLALLTLAALAARSRDQLGYWTDSVTLFERAIAVTSGNYLAHNNLGVALEAAGNNEAAGVHYAEAVRLNPTWPEALNNYGISLARHGRYEEARRYFTDAIRIRPGFAKAENNLATTFGREGNLDEAIAHYTRAVELDGEYFDAVYALADALRRRGRFDESARRYETALALRPGFPPAVAALEGMRPAGGK